MGLPATGLFRKVMHNGVKAVKALHQALVNFAINLRLLVFYKLKVDRDLASAPPSASYIIKKPFLKGYTDTRWHRLYASVNGIISDNYVPEDLFFLNIERKLNPKERAWSFHDKNCYDRLKLPCTFPQTLGRVMLREFRDPDYRTADPSILTAAPTVVVKPSLDSGGGKNVKFMSGAEASEFARRSLRDNPAEEYVFQLPVRQTSRLNVLGPDSVNTQRIMTMFLNGNPWVVSAVLRVGRRGARVDNQSSGGIAVGIDNGRLREKGYDILLKPYDRHPDTGMVFKDFFVPEWEAATALTLKIQSVIPEVNMISWDIAIDENEKPVVIEMNTHDQAIDLHQAANGPLFGDRFAEVLERTKPKLFFSLPID